MGSVTPRSSRLAEDTVRDGAEPPPTSGPSGARRIGRYLVVDRIARGGMGEVVRAYDPKLHREVALKSLRADMLDEVGRLRLLREAQAMAQLSHPNVVAVFDAETQEDDVVIVMEYVAGTTLKEWAPQVRDKRRVLEAYLAAGRGLLAAHEAGLVHRDFKPSNVLVADEGRTIKVTDFGLARAQVGEHFAERSSDARGLALDEPGSTLTAAGQIAGTPSYMAPEQHIGAEANTASDEFAYCVSLWEALCGANPYPARDLDELVLAKLKGPPAWPNPAGVPRWVGAVLRRGLSPKPGERWPDLRELFARLDRAVRPRRVALFVGASVAVVAAIGLAWQARGPGLCEGAPALAAAAWNPERAETIRAALIGTGLSFAEETWPRVEQGLDDYARRWVEQHTDTCEATHVRGDRSAAALDVRMRCLERARSELDATVSVLAAADATTTQHAVESVAGLPAPERCADADVLAVEHSVPDDPATASEVAALREILGNIRVTGRAGRFKEAAQLSTEIAARVDATAFEPLRAEHRAQLGRVQLDLGEYAAAEATLAEAMRTALSIGAERIATDAASNRGHLLGVKLHRFAEARIALDVALGLAPRLADPSHLVWAHFTRGGVASYEGKADEAESEIRLAIDLADEIENFDQTRAVWFEQGLAHLLFKRGRYAEAELEMRGMIAECERIFGPLHPTLGAAYSGFGALAAAQGRFDEAEPYLRTAREILEAAHGPRHDATLEAHENLAAVLFYSGRRAEAEKEIRAVRAGSLEALGPDHPRVANASKNLGAVLTALRRYDEAEVEFRRALATAERLGAVDHPVLVEIESEFGEFLLGRERADEAIPLLERAWSIRSKGTFQPEEVAGTGYTLAQALVETGGDRRRALAIAKEAHRHCVDVGARHVEMCHELETLIEQQSRP